MKFHRWVVALAVEVDPDECRRCGLDREDGRHLTLPEEYNLSGKPCEKPQEHHTFRRRRIPLKVERPVVW